MFENPTQPGAPASPAGLTPRPTPAQPRGAEGTLRGQPAEPEDILSALDAGTPAVRPSGGFAPALRPVAAAPAGGIPAASAAPTTRRLGRIILLSVLGLLGAGAIAFGGWYAWTLYSPSQGGLPPAPRPSPIAAPTPTPPIPITPPVAPTPSAVTPPPPPLDTDRDGLSDDDEKLYGTNPNAVDTDSDGLTDRDEVSVFKTDPNNPDTDGDGYKDGDEVRNGYNPKGSGKLLNLP